MKTKANSPYALVACQFDLNGVVPTEIQLTPTGQFKADDGRPFDVVTGYWLINTDIANLVIAKAQQKQGEFVIDYDHQTLRAVSNGQPAPSAGWFKGSELQWREGVGLFATNVQWTDTARQLILAKEYRYISPVFLYDKQTGAMQTLIMAALTNVPAVDGMQSLAALGIDFYCEPQETPMNDDMLEWLRCILDLPLASTTDDIAANLKKLADMVTAMKTTNTAAASSSVIDILQAQTTQIAALSSQVTDPAKFVPIEQVIALQAELNQAKAQTVTQASVEKENLITAALSDGRLAVALKPWAESLPLTQLNEFLDKQSPIAALSSLQTKRNPPPSQANLAMTLSADEIAYCSHAGISTDDFLKMKVKNNV